MMTFRQIAARHEFLPVATSWYLADLGEARGKQALFIRQASQRLKVLREHALIESAVSSNRIEGVEVDKTRVATIIFGRPLLRNRNEEEVAGYREALKLIHEQGIALSVSEKTILTLHRLALWEIGYAGKYKEKDADIIQKYPDGTSRIRFKTVSAVETPAAMKELLDLWDLALRERWIHPLVALAAFNLDFLCVHPFRDGNGRVSRLLFLLMCYHFGYEVGRYISLERLIEQYKERYYETLEQSSQFWHEGKHDPWPFINYYLFILKTACQEFEERLSQTKEPKGAKAELVLNTIRKQTGDFRLSDIERACPSVGRDWIRSLLSNLKASGELTCQGRGPAARWHYHDGKGSTSK